jgi:cobyrinic acid a,c-diamide synthase
MWLSAAAGRRCRNLDFFMMGRERIAAAFPARAAGADLALVEANHGLHDGPDPAGSDSGAALAALLGLPVVLVVNAQRLNRGVAPLIQGQIAFDPAVRFAGVVLNRVHGARHERKLRDAVERYCRIEVLGALPDLPELAIAERHLGLTPLAEAPDLTPLVDRLGQSVARHLDLDRIEALARTAGPTSAVLEQADLALVVEGQGSVARTGTRTERSSAPAEGWRGKEVSGARFERDGGPRRQDPEAGTGKALGRVRIGIAMDRAFTFYYPENLEALIAAGAELVPFSPLDDPRLPPVAGLYIGGGFPEHFLERLEANAGMREDVRRAIAAGVPAWAECGGL